MKWYKSNAFDGWGEVTKKNYGMPLEKIPYPGIFYENSPALEQNSGELAVTLYKPIGVESDSTVSVRVLLMIG